LGFVPLYYFCNGRAVLLALAEVLVCVRYANCYDDLYRRNRRQKVNAVSIHTDGCVIISTHVTIAHGQVVTYVKVL